MNTLNLSDPLFSSQWYLKNTGQRGGDSRLDINVLPAWEAGINGLGVVIAINDDGIDLTHPDLVANIDASKVYDTARDTTGQGLVGTDNSHGTVVGSIVGMVANSIGGVGVAYKATLVPAVAIGTTVAFASANLFKANLAAGADVSVNSWGADPAFAENFGDSGPEEDQAWGAALRRAAAEGRNGLGMVIEVSAGNERANRADAGLSNFTGNKVTIAVGAVDERGIATDYSTPGASLLLTAFGGVESADPAANTGFGAVSADIQSSGGYNKTEGEAGDYAYQNQGTSYSGPMVGAAAALILQANPKLGFRDVSAILAMTARQTDATNASWVINGARDWNLGGMHFSRDYGYGLLDVAAAVRLAQSWTAPAATFANWTQAVSGPMAAAVQNIPDNETQPLLVSTQITDAIRIDRVEFDLNLTAASPSQLKAEITSPSGTTVTLFDRPLTRPLNDGEVDQSAPETAWPGTFTIGSTAFMGESSSGTWTLKLTDLVSGTEASFNSLTIRAWGSAPSPNDQYVFTNEYKGNRTLSDAGGVDTLNAAAMDHALTLNLAGTSSLGSTDTLSFAPGTQIENAIGGFGPDLLIGNDAGNVLRSNAGNDTLEGGLGNDTLDGGAGNDTAIFPGSLSDYTITLDETTGTVTIASTSMGTDTVTMVESFQFGATSPVVPLAALTDRTPPTVTAASPASGSKQVPLDGSLSFTFSEPVRLGVGPIQLKTSDGKVVETFSGASVSVTGNTLTLKPSAKLQIFTSYAVDFGASAVQDMAGNAMAASKSYSLKSATVDGLYNFFVVAFAAAPGATYMGQLAEAWNYFSGLPPRPDNMPVLQQIVEIFTTKKQFTDVYPTGMANRDLATLLVNNIVKTSASAAARTQAIDDIDTVLSNPDFAWSRGKMLYTVFGNLASKELNDPVWGGTAQQFHKQLVVSRYLTEEIGVATEDIATLRGVIANVTPDTDVSTIDKIVQIIGTVPPPGG